MVRFSSLTIYRASLCLLDHGQPSDIAESIIPQWNSFVFFEVNPVSFHQVSLSYLLFRYT